MLYDHVDLRVSDLFEGPHPLRQPLYLRWVSPASSEDADSICYYDPGDTRAKPSSGLVVDPEHRP